MATIKMNLHAGSFVYLEALQLLLVEANYVIILLRSLIQIKKHYKYTNAVIVFQSICSAQFAMT